MDYVGSIPTSRAFIMNNTKNNSVGVIVGRFQTPYLHEGHCKLIDTAMKNHYKVLIFIGVSSTKNTIRDTLRCAFKCSNRTYTKDGAEVSMPVQKNPLDKSKASKAGKFDIDRVVYIKEMNDYEPTINAQDFSDVRSRASKMFV